jgi:hypothetical protein
MNAITAEDFRLLKRQVRDVQSVAANIQHHLRKLTEPRASPRPGGIVARLATCVILSRTERRSLDAVMKQHFGSDRDLAGVTELRAPLRSCGLHNHHRKPT